MSCQCLDSNLITRMLHNSWRAGLFGEIRWGQGWLRGGFGQSFGDNCLLTESVWCVGGERACVDGGWGSTTTNKASHRYGSLSPMQELRVNHWRVTTKTRMERKWMNDYCLNTKTTQTWRIYIQWRTVKTCLKKKKLNLLFSPSKMDLKYRVL